MRKIVIHRPGGYSSLCLEHHPDPVAGPGEVLVAVRSIGVNYADCITRMGLYASAKELVGYPLTPGFEAAGEIVALGAGVNDLVPGDEVMVLSLFGAYATRMALSRNQVFRLPPGMPLASAGGFPTVFLTAWYAVCELAQPGPGADVLIHSAAGGVGSALVQLCKLSGCRVVGVVGHADKAASARDLGADAVIDKSTEDLWSRARALAPGGYAAVFDANGVATLMDSYRHLAPMGRLVVYGFHSMLPRGPGMPNRLRLLWDWWRTPCFDPLRMTNRNRSVMAFNLSYLWGHSERLREGVEQLLGWYGQGRIRLPAVTAYAFERVADAHRDLESGRTVGKLVLRV